MSEKETSGYYAAIETYNGEGTQSLIVTDTIDSNSSSFFWNKNDKQKQIVHGHSLSELNISGISKSASWGGVQTFTIDNETDCIGDIYICLTVDFNTSDTPLDSDLSPKTVTTLLQKPSPRDALKDPSKLEKKGWYKRGVAKGDTRPIATPIGFPNGWLHLKTDANDLGSGFRNGDGGLDAVDSYGLPTDAINLPGVWGVHQDSAPRAQAWEDIQDVLVKDKDLFTVQEFDCKDTYLDPNNNEELIYQRGKDIGIGEFIVQDQGRTASNCYDINSNFITSVDRFRSFNVMESYYHNGLRNKFNDEFSHPVFSDQNSITAEVIMGDPKLKGHQIFFGGYHVDDQTDQHTRQISAVFPNTVTTAQVQANLSSYNTALYNSINNIAVIEDYGTWSGTITSNVVTTPNRNWDHILWFGRYLNNQYNSGQLQAIQVAPNVAAPYGDNRPQISTNIWTPQSTLSFVDDKNNGSIAHVYITEDPYHSKDGNVINVYVDNMKLWMANYEMEHPYKNWPGNISTDNHRASRYHTNAIQTRTWVFETDLLNPKITTDWFAYKEEFWESTEGFAYPELPCFKPKPGSELVSAMYETISGVNYIRLDFWKPTKVDDRDITQQELEIYISSTRSILTKIQNEADDSVQGVADCPRVFWTITTTTGNAEILIPLLEYNRPIDGPNNGIGQFIGGGVNNDYSLGENDIRFDLHGDRSFMPWVADAPWEVPDFKIWDYQILSGYPTVTTTDPTRVNTSRLQVYIPNTFYKLNEAIAKAPEWVIAMNKFGNLYTAYRGRFEDIENDKNTIFEFRTANYISGSDNIPGSLIRVLFNTYFPSGQQEYNLTAVELSLEVMVDPPALNTITNRKGHDNIISQSLIPYVEHPTPNPYTYSYLPKYLSYNDSEEIKKLGTEYIDVDENGTFRVYRSQGVLASDLFISYLNKQDINNLVDYYNRNISYRPLFQSDRDVPETIIPQDGDIISYLQKVEAVEDPPRRPDNLIYYQSDFNGYCTAMSSDGNTYAVSQGRMYGDESEAYANVNGVDRYRVRRPGLVRVFKKENGTWTLNKTFRAPNSKLSTRPKGHVWYVSNGYNQHIDLSADGNRIVIGDAGGDNNSFTTYDYNNVTKKWTKVSEVQYGHSQSIIPQNTGLRKYINMGDPPEYYTFGSEFGSCLSLSDDGNRIVLRYIGPEINSPNNTYTTEHSVKIYNWDGTNWQADNSTPDVSVSLNHSEFIHKGVDNDDVAVRLGGYPINQQPIWSQTIYSRSGSICLSGDGNTYIMGDHNGVIPSLTGGTLQFTVQSVGGSNKFFYDGQQQPTIELVSGTTYTFSYPWQQNHHVRLSTTPDGIHAGGTELEPGPQNSYDVPINSAPGTVLYYYCHNHAGMGGQINIVAPTIDSGINVYKLFNGIWTRVLSKYNGSSHGDGHSCAVNYDGTRIAFGNIIDENGVGSVSIYDWDSVSNSYSYVKEIVGQPNSYLGTSIKFNKDGTKLAIGCPYGINEKKPLNKPPTKDLMNKHVIVNDGRINQGEPVQTEFGRIDVYRYPDFVAYSNPPQESYEIGFDKNAKHFKARGGYLYDTELGAIKGWAEYGSPASLGMRNERQRLSHGEVHLYEYKSGNWENVLKIDATSGERGNSKQKSWPGTHGKYGIYEGTADGLGVSVSMDGNGDVILAGAPFTSTIGKIQEKLDWYPGGGMTAAYSIHKNNEESLVEEGDPVSSLLLADTSLRSHIRETEEEVGRSYLFEIGKYTHNPPAPTPVENTSSIKMNYSDGYTLVNNAQFKLNHDITDFINLPDIGESIRWDKQFNSVPEGAYYPPLKGDYQNPEWADSDLKSKVDFPLLSIIKKVEIIVNDKVWQTIENEDLLSIYSTEMTESLYQTTILNSRGRSLSDGTRKENSKERWIPGKKYNITIPIPGFTSSVDPRFNNFTNISENGFLAGIAPDSKFTVKVYYNELEKIWDTNNVSAMQGYTAPIYRVPHVTTKIEDGQDSNGNPSSLVKDGAIYQTTGKSSGTGLYVTNVPEPWNPKISFNTKMYGQKIIMNREELDVLKNIPEGINKRIKMSMNVNNRFINVSRNQVLSMNLDEITIYTSHLIINIDYTNTSTKPYLKTAQLFLNSKPHSILDGLFMRGISNSSIGLYSNEYNKGYYVYPLSNTAFGGSSVSFSNFDTIRLEMIFDSQGVLNSDSNILSEFVNVSVTARGQASVSYKNGSAVMNY